MTPDSNLTRNHPIRDDTRSGGLPRDAMIPLVLRKLSLDLPAPETKSWLEVLDDLAMTEAEWAMCTDALLRLAVAPASRAATVGIRELGGLYGRGEADAGTLVPTLVHATGHAVGGVAKKAFVLLKRIARKAPAQLPAVRGVAVDALESPHAALRKDAAKWLGGGAPDGLPEELAARLIQAAEGLDPRDREPMDGLLTALGAAGLEPAGETAELAAILTAAEEALAAPPLPTRVATPLPAGAPR